MSASLRTDIYTHTSVISDTFLDKLAGLTMEKVVVVVVGEGRYGIGNRKSGRGAGCLWKCEETKKMEIILVCAFACDFISFYFTYLFTYSFIFFFFRGVGGERRKTGFELRYLKGSFDIYSYESPQSAPPPPPPPPHTHTLPPFPSPTADNVCNRDCCLCG